MTARSRLPEAQPAGAPRVVEVDPRTDPRWAEFALLPGASVFTSPPWIAAVCATYDFVPSARIAMAPDGRPVAGLAWVDVGDVRGDRTISLPFSDRADPLAADLPTWTALAGPVLDRPVPFTHRGLDGGAAERDPRLAVLGSAAWHGTALDVPIEQVHARLTQAARRNIRLSERRGARVEYRCSLDAVRDFHALHTRLRKRKYRLLAQPVELFERIWREFSPSGSIVVVCAYRGDTLIAGALCLSWNGVLYYKFAASAADHLELRPNEGVGWAALRWAAEHGHHLFDWGLSDLDQPGLVAYKRKWATTERRIVTVRSMSARAPRPETDDLLGRLTELLTGDDVPDDVTERAGRLLYRNFC